MFKFHFKNSFAKSKRVFTVLDIGTENIKALVCRVRDKDLEILGAGQLKQPAYEMEGGSITDIAGVIERSNRCIRMAEREAGVSSRQLVLGVAGELIKGSTSEITYKRRDPSTKIHQEELKNIIHKVQWKAFEKARSELAYESGFEEIDIKLVHASIVETKIDSYKVSNPIGFQGREVTMRVFNAFSPLVHFGAIQTICAELDRELIAVMAEPYAVGRLMTCMEEQGNSGIFIDVGGGSTDLCIVINEGITATKLFHLGGRAFTKRLAHSLNISNDEAEEVKIAFSNKALEHQSHQIVEKALRSDLEIWLAGVHFSLKEGSKSWTLPPTLYLCGGGSQLSLIKEGLEQEDWHKKLSFPRKPQIKKLVPSMLKGVNDLTGRLSQAKDITPIALGKIGMEILVEEKILSKMLQKVVRLMQV